MRGDVNAAWGKVDEATLADYEKFKDVDVFKYHLMRGSPMDASSGLDEATLQRVNNALTYAIQQKGSKSMAQGISDDLGSLGIKTDDYTDAQGVKHIDVRGRE